jgi:superfamily II DNA/RNA helicase
MRTKHHARKLAKTLTDAGIPAVDLHGNLSQNARDRNLAEFSSGEVRVLVATDVAAAQTDKISSMSLILSFALNRIKRFHDGVFKNV